MTYYCQVGEGWLKKKINYLSLIFLFSGLQDNPWYCDCKISKLMEISKMTDTPVVLMDLFLTCSGPENLAGVLFQRAELDNCVKPSVMTSATKITSPLGSNVLLRCDATGFPTPNLYWAKSDGSPVNNTGIQAFARLDVLERKPPAADDIKN